MADKTDSVSIRKGVGQAKLVTKAMKGKEWQNVWLYHVLVNGHTVRSFLSSEAAEGYVAENYGHVPLVRRDY